MQIKLLSLIIWALAQALVFGQDIVRPVPQTPPSPTLPTTPPPNGPGYRNSQVPASGKTETPSLGAKKADSLRAQIKRDIELARQQADKELKSALNDAEFAIQRTIEELKRQQLLAPEEIERLEQDLKRQLKQQSSAKKEGTQDSTCIVLGRNRFLIITDDGSVTFKKRTDPNTGSDNTASNPNEQSRQRPSTEDDDDDRDEDEEVLYESRTNATPSPTDGKKKDKGPGDVHTRLLALDLGINTWMHNGSLNLPVQHQDLELKQPNSINVLLHLFPTRVNLAKQHLHLRTALTFDFHNYKFLNPITIKPRLPTFDYEMEKSTNFSRNKLAMTVMQVPLLLQFTAKPRKLDRCFRFAVGGYGGIVISSHTKQRSSEEGRVKIKDDYNIDRLRYGLTARVGYGILELYANYSLNPLFIEGRNAPELYPFAFGVNLLRL